MHVKARFCGEAVKKYPSSYYAAVEAEVADLAEDAAFSGALHSGKYDQFFDTLSKVETIENGTDAGVWLNYITGGMIEADIPLDKPGKLVAFDSDSPTEEVIARFAIKAGPETTYFLVYDGGDTFPEEKDSYDTWGGFESDESAAKNGRGVHKRPVKSNVEGSASPRAKRWAKKALAEYKANAARYEYGYEIEDLVDTLGIDSDELESCADDLDYVVTELAKAGFEML
jgi:hypothetical protein